MKDFARPGRTELIFFEPGDKVRWHENNGTGPYITATVVRTGRTRVLIMDRSDGRAASIWVPNTHLSHDPKFYSWLFHDVTQKTHTNCNNS